MATWQAIDRHDGSRGWVELETGELRGSAAEVAGLWDLEAGLAGLLAAADGDRTERQRRPGAGG